MALLNRKLGSLLVSTSIHHNPYFALPKSIIIHSHSLSQLNNNDSIVNSISDSFKKTHNWGTLTKTFSSVQLTHSLVQQVLLQLKQPEHARYALNFFYWSAKSQNFQHQIYSYCIVIHILVHAKQLPEAKILLHSALKTSAPDSTRSCILESLLGSYNVVGSSTLVFDLLVQAYAKLRMLEDAFEVCCYLENHGFSLTLLSFNALLHGILKSGENVMVWKVYEHMIEKRKYPNEITIRTMISALCKEGKLQVVVDLLDKILGKRCSPIVIVNTHLVFKVIEEGRIEDGMELLKRMLQKNLILDSIAYSFVVYTKLKLGNLELAWEVHEEMLKRGFIANSFLFSSFIRAYSERGRIHEAENVLREMENMGLKPYDETFNYLIEGCAKAGEMKASVRHCEEMIRRGLVPSCSTFNEMVRGLCEIGDSENANALLTLVLDKGFLPNETTYSHLIAGYGKEGNIQQVFKLYYEMEYKSLSPGLPVFTSLIRCLCHCGKLKEAERYLRIMKDRSVVLSEDIYEALITGHFEKGDKTGAGIIYNEMVARGMKPHKWGNFTRDPITQELPDAALSGYCEHTRKSSEEMQGQLMDCVEHEHSMTR
ncbi:PREDICTED: pentatricopeptide repeat-containing protein At1g66345, mitochondrial isoform X1 [Theobroma cacao]|uniref:Pentatricopeptide repeat-containing protein At1g66345, mitochondrial isoform X1 n=1 Tax=Theobroma cacao TaxID=3641 RepID=A0AB32UYX0_THECC|nr:PREDICTED: pentatricopeptide repeat-containing protein At1g66345, mitochondrial isoform X1 [Theobroma cacao]